VARSSTLPSSMHTAASGGRSGESYVRRIRSAPPREPISIVAAVAWLVICRIDGDLNQRNQSHSDSFCIQISLSGFLHNHAPGLRRCTMLGCSRLDRLVRCHASCPARNNPGELGVDRLVLKISIPAGQVPATGCHGRGPWNTAAC
jgi:hypothetical protein